MPTEHVQSPARTAQPQRTTQRQRAAQRQRTEDRILAAAAALFLDRGYRETTVRAIAAAAEVSVGRVMGLGDKDALLIACCDRWIAQMLAGSDGMPRGSAGRPTTSAVQDHLLGIFLPFLEFFAAHEDLARDYAAALIRVRGRPEVFTGLADRLRRALTDDLTSIGISAANARASAAALYDSYLGVLFRWAASDMDFDEAVAALADTIAFHTRIRRLT